MNKDCVSLEVAQELQAAGYKEKTHRGWVKFSLNEKPILFELLEGLQTLSGEVEWIIPAPTATQLADALPKHMSGTDVQYSSEYFLEIQYIEGWNVSYYGFDTLFTAPTLPDALGKMMVYLLTNKLI